MAQETLTINLVGISTEWASVMRMELCKRMKQHIGCSTHFTLATLTLQPSAWRGILFSNRSIRFWVIVLIRACSKTDSIWLSARWILSLMYTNHLSLWIYAGTRRLTRQIVAWRGTYGEERHWSVEDRTVLHPGTPPPLPKTCAFCWMHWLRVFRHGAFLKETHTIDSTFPKALFTHPNAAHQRLHLLRIWSINQKSKRLNREWLFWRF